MNNLDPQMLIKNPSKKLEVILKELRPEKKHFKINKNKIDSIKKR